MTWSRLQECLSRPYGNYGRAVNGFASKLIASRSGKAIKVIQAKVRRTENDRPLRQVLLQDGVFDTRNAFDVRKSIGSSRPVHIVRFAFYSPSIVVDPILVNTKRKAPFRF